MEVEMAILKINTLFKPEFSGELVTSRATVDIGPEEGQVFPYDMLLGALASCFYSTFLDIAEKKRIHYDSVDIEVTGEKRTEIPATLKWVNLKITIKNAEKEKGLIQAAELAGQYCSIYQTLSHVAEMKTQVVFE